MNAQSPTVAVLGVGHLTRHMVPALVTGPEPPQVLLSARNAETSAALAEAHGLEVVADNAELISRAGIVLFAVRPFQVADALAGLPWRKGQTLVSLCAGVPVEALAAQAGAATVVRAMPVIAAVHGESATCLYPEHGPARALLERCGPVTAVATEQEFEAASICGALFGWSAALVGELADWFVEAGVDPQAARPLVAQTFRAAATYVRDNPDLPIERIVADLCKPESITGLGLATLRDADAFAPWRAAAQAVLDKLTAES